MSEDQLDRRDFLKRTVAWERARLLRLARSRKLAPK